MPPLGQAEVEDWQSTVAQYGGDLCAAVFMRAMGAPGGDDPLRPDTGLANDAIIFGPNRIDRGPHVMGVSVAPGKNIGDAKGTKAQGARSSFTTFYGWVVLHFGCGRRVEHDEQRGAPSCVPRSGQPIAIALAVGI